MNKVVKFGGSSLCNADEFRKVKKIIDSDSSRSVVVVSAPGKENKKDNKVTDLLYLTYSHIKYGVDFSEIFNVIKNKYLNIVKDLGLKLDLSSEFIELEKRMNDKSISEEELVSRGEYFSALIMANYLGYTFVDSKDLIHFSYDGKVIENETLKSINDEFIKYKKMVVPGFYGSYPNKKICLFTRGGSDLTGSYMAKGIKADKYENWTDVSGFYFADPKIVDNPRKINEVTYQELRELSYMGASVIHEETIIPLQEDNIPLEILNTNAPTDKGTLISKEAKDNKYLLTGITGKKNFMAITFVKRKLADKLKVMLSVLNIFDRYHVSVEHIPTSIDSFSVVVDKSSIEESYYDIIAEIKKIDDIISISEDDDIALIAIVGRNMVRKTGVSGRILHVFGTEKINIKLIDQGREEINIIVGISNNDFEKSILALYNKFSLEEAA
jgi:aspartate kinase